MKLKTMKCFRPQQGLTIMNRVNEVLTRLDDNVSVPNRG